MIEKLESVASHGGLQEVYRHASSATRCDMAFSIFLPAQAKTSACPVITYLSGLTCTHANVTEKGEFRRAAAELGLIVVCPDTSPRGEAVPDAEGYDFGKGAGFYLDAAQEPWRENYRMETYVVEELSELIAADFPTDPGRQGVMGHSMGGHGAMTLALRHPGRWRSVSAFSPICAPSRVPWGRKAFGGYLGGDETAWRAHDAVSLIEDGARLPDLLVDVGAADPFLERELKPELLEAACAAAGQPLTLRRQAGYDHSYYFVSTFMDEHLRWHAGKLGALPA